MVILSHFKVVSFKADSVLSMYIFSFNFYMFNSCQKSISWKNLALPIEKFPSLSLPRNVICYNTLLFNFCSIICQVVIYRRLKTKENFKFLALKVVTVAYERWSLTRGSKYSDLTWKLLVFWKTGHWGEVVAYERWWQPEVPLYLTNLRSVLSLLHNISVL